MIFKAHAFADGGYLRRLAHDAKVPLVDPMNLARVIVGCNAVQTWAGQEQSTVLTRTTYYDARPDEEAQSTELAEYWAAVELLPDTDLGFGSLRGGGNRRAPRQKGVDTLIAVDMLVGAFTKIFDLAVVIAGDADFVPVLEEVRRCGVKTIVAAEESSVSQDLRRAADRFVKIGRVLGEAWFPPLSVSGRVWQI